METPVQKLERLKRARSYLRTSNIQFVKLHVGAFEHIIVNDDVLPTRDIKAMYDRMLTAAIEHQENIILRSAIAELRGGGYQPLIDFTRRDPPQGGTGVR